MRTILTTILATISIAATAQTKQPITYDQIQNGTFAARSISGLRSSVDGEHYTAITPDRHSIVKYRYDTGEAIDTLFSNIGMFPSFAIPDYSLSADENLVMLPAAIEPIYRHSFKAENWIYDRSTKTFTQLSPAGKQMSATFSPDGRRVAFVRDNNLFVVDLINKTESKITFDGAAGSVINGQSDWVYEEEFGFDRAYEWSPSSDAIAYYRFDESKVENYYMPVFKGATYPENRTFKYPKAGEVNATVSIRVYNLATASHSIVNVGDNIDQYIPRIEWTGRTGELVVHRVNRAQNHYDMLLCDIPLNSVRVLYSEESQRYVDRIDGNKVRFIPEGNRFIVLSEADGWRHLYLYDMTGKFIAQLTKGVWEVTSIDAIDVRGRKVYYTAAASSPMCREPFVTSFHRTSRRTAQNVLPSAVMGGGTYSVDFSGGAKYYIQRFSNPTTPTVTTVHSAADGMLLRTLEDNASLADTIAKYAMPTRQLIKVLAADSVTELNGYMLLPADFDPQKVYPLVMCQYSGPGSQLVAERWGVNWEAAMVSEGFIVACVDGRGTGFRGFDFRSCTYRDLGNIETQDQIAVAKRLSEMSYIDSDRIGIWGWSYGGFMALNCILKGSDVFASAVAIAPVTTWRYYDTIYTEIYNGTPQNNPEGYDRNSPINFADRLKGKLLIAHGTADDNVHIQNAYDMFSALNRAGKEYEMIVYPDQNHGMGEDRHLLLRRVIDFFVETLK